MLGTEDILCELADQEEHGFPPGFRFHPTDEELVTFYLASKVFHGSHNFFSIDITEVDLNKCEPWDLPDVAKMGTREWYFYSLRDRKYPSGLRTNRATATGYWKATGKDKEIHSAAAVSTGALIGIKKTLVFYLGRAPRGQKTKWVMHEYRLHGHYSARTSAAKEEWVICRICRKTGEKTNMHINEICSPFEPGSSSTAPKESFLPQLIDCQLTEQFLKNQASVIPIEYATNEDSHRAPQMYLDKLQIKLGPFPSSFHFHPASTFYPATDIGVNPSASFSSMLIRSLITNEDQNNSLMHSSKNFAAELVKTGPNFPYMLPGADEFEWYHGFQQASGQCNNHNYLDGGSCTSSYIDRTSAALEMEQGGAGGLQMVVDPNFRFPIGESWAVDA